MTVPGNFLTASALPVVEDPIYIERHPVVLTTDSYLNNPIEFSTDRRLIPQTVILQASSSIAQIQRDVAQFLTVEINGPLEYLSVSMESPLYDRDIYARVIDTTFTELQ